MSGGIRQRLRKLPRFLPLYRKLWLTRIQSWFFTPLLRKPSRWQAGLSVLIPECGTPELLALTLQHAVAALAKVKEPNELIVLVNGAPASHYSALQQQYPQVQWHFFEDALGFNGAIEAGLQQVQHPCTYLLNSDMQLEADALATILGFRSPQSFALASQIFFPEGVRREETGLSSFTTHGGRTTMFEKEPPKTALASRSIYASGGSSLFRTDLLRQYVNESKDYSPFYWEDADWGARAWAENLECWFVPQSKALHEHRGTIKKRFSKEEIDRVVDRNGILFELRNHFSWLDGYRLLIHLTGRPEQTQVELATAAVAEGIARVRKQSMARQRLGLKFHEIEKQGLFGHLGEQYFYGGWKVGAPTVLWVTPFSVLPPRHGGARRIAELAKSVSRHVNLILLSDEMVSYKQCDFDAYPFFQALHLVQGRKDIAGKHEQDFSKRLKTHTPAKLRQAMNFLIDYYQVDLVQVEFMEASLLVEERKHTLPFVASLHDVYLQQGHDDELQRRILARFDTLLACSNEDAALMGELNHHIVPNGAARSTLPYVASAASGTLLFMGPFRYTPNFEGILAFIEHCWPAIKARVPHAKLRILAGTEATRPEYQSPLLAQAGIRVVTQFVDPAPELADCALTLNPQLAIRGSALKVAESLMAQRVCVSTAEGARGFSGLQSQALQIVTDWPTMTVRIVALLQDAALRHTLEQSAVRDHQQLSWEGQAERLLAVYRQLLPADKFSTDAP